jgi:hypothetical protein
VLIPNQDQLFFYSPLENENTKGMAKQILSSWVAKSSAALLITAMFGSFGAWLGLAASVPALGCFFGASVGTLLGGVTGYYATTSPKEREGSLWERIKYGFLGHRFTRRVTSLYEVQKIALFGSLFLIIFAILGALAGDGMSARNVAMGSGAKHFFAPFIWGGLSVLGMSMLVIYSFVSGGLKNLRSAAFGGTLGALAGLTFSVYYGLGTFHMTFFLMFTFAAIGMVIPLMFLSGYLKEQLFENDASYNKFRRQVNSKLQTIKPIAQFLPQRTTINDIIAERRQTQPQLDQANLSSAPKEEIELSRVEPKEPICWETHEIRIQLEGEG